MKLDVTGMYTLHDCILHNPLVTSHVGLEQIIHDILMSILVKHIFYIQSVIQ